MQKEPSRSKGASVAEGQTDWAALDAMTEEEIMAAAMSDPDAQPSPEGAKMRRVVRCKWLRMKLAITLEELAGRYHIPLATLVAWERYEAEPDAVALAFMDAIAGDPEGVAKALTKTPQPAQAAE